jgi:hypothetical protein
VAWKDILGTCTYREDPYGRRIPSNTLEYAMDFGQERSPFLESRATVSQSMFVLTPFAGYDWMGPSEVVEKMEMQIFLILLTQTHPETQLPHEHRSGE